MSHVRRAVACAGALAVTLFSFAVSTSPAANAVDPASTTTADAAVTWLKAQQESDGGFELANFGGFETLDASIAIAQAAQTGDSWSTTQAADAVAAVQYGGSGATPFDAIDAYAQTIPTLGILTAGTAAKNIVLGALPYGFDPTEFDPADDGTPVDLVDLMGGCSASGDPVFNLALYTILAQSQVCSAPPADALQLVRDAQRSDGGWNYLGDDDPAVGSDPDTTALAVEALVAAGAGATDSTDATVHDALGFFASTQQADGAWQSFGTDDPNSTAVSIFAITAGGFDPESPCWRDTVDPTRAGDGYASPTAWLRSQQLSDPPEDAGRIASPNDPFGMNTFATSQTVEALLQSWLPIARATPQSCDVPVTPVEPVTPVTPDAPDASVVVQSEATVVDPVAVTATPRFTG
jgi:hypothetical protein